MIKKLKMIALVLLAFLTAFDIRTPAQSPSPIDAALAAQYFREAHTLCQKDDGKLWGKSLCAPILLVDPRTRAVFANQADREGNLVKAGDVFTGQLPPKMNIANTATAWAGVKWTMIMFPLPEDKFRRTALMAHEMWHRIQDDLGFPNSSAANNHLDSLEGRLWLQLEWRALAAALMARGAERRQQAINDALIFRKYRRTLFPNAAAEEQAMEMHEGLAEYTGVRLSGSANLNQYLVNTNLREAADRQTFVRSFAYANGPAYGVLLDETKQTWRKNLNKDDDLGNLLEKILSIKLLPNLKQAAQARAKIYDGEKLLAAETARENNRQKIIADYRAKLVDGPVLIIPLQKMNMQFNPGNLVPLGSLGTVYPNIRIVDVWGILTVSKGALMNPMYSKIFVVAPSNLTSSSPIQGEGWTLELNTGWTIVKDAREGDYTVKKSTQ